MSWLDRVQSDYLITTPDGKEYRPQWREASKTKEFNIAEFEFPGIEGTLVKRGLSKGRRFHIEFYFQGADHLDVASAFEISADDPRPWNISHPLYGLILGQPISLLFDNRDSNVSKITGVIVETIKTTFPKTSFDPSTKIIFDKGSLDVITQNNFTLTFPVVTTPISTALTTNVKKMYDIGSKRILNPLDAQKFFNLYNKANSLIQNVTSGPLATLRAIQSMINVTFLFVDTVKNRVDNLVAQYNSIRDLVSSFTKKSDKKVYENNAGTLISAMAAASVTNPDYTNRVDVLLVIEAILAAYNDFINDLDFLQSANNGSVDSYVPDADSIYQLSSLINFTVSNLFDISVSSKQERILYTEKDTNLILLAHRLYGLTPDDATITKLMNDNSVSLNEMLVIKKDRKIIWYV